MDNIHENNAIIEYYNKLTSEERRILHSIYADPNESIETKKRLEKVLFKDGIRPPTPEEFLDYRNGWIPKHITESLFPQVKSAFLKVLEPQNDYQNIVNYGATRCFGKDTEVLMYDLSSKKIQDIEEGDILMGDDGTPRNVIQLYRGYGDLYKVNQNKGDNYIVNKDHNLVLQYTSLQHWVTKKTISYSEKVITPTVEEYLSYSKKRKHNLKGIKPKVIEFKNQDIEIDPYFLGLWLGDGHSTTPTITTMDKEIKEYIAHIAEKYKLDLTYSNKKNNRAKTFRIIRRDRLDKNILLHKLRDLDLIKNKHIPKKYIQNSKEVRLQLLAGLIDTDGCKEGNNFTISTANPKLKDGIVLLCRTLGFRTNALNKKTKLNGKIFKSFVVSIYGDLREIPVRLPRKKIDTFNMKVSPQRTGIEVSHIGTGDFYGFEIDGNNRFLLKDFTIVRNTGKSFMERLLIVYTIIYMHHLRSINDYFDIPTNPAIYLLSFKIDKAKQLLMKPVYDILEHSPRFIKVGRQDKVKPEQAKHGVNSIVWTKASDVGAITLSSGLQILLGNDDPMSIIGADVFQMYVSEIAFFIENAGATEEEIFRLYTDGAARIRATFPDNPYLSFIYLDTSANNADSQIENYILNELRFKKTTFFQQLKQWDVNTEKRVPKYLETGQTFKICTGDGTIPAILEPSKEEITEIPPDLIQEIPIDYYDAFKDNLIKSIKDIAGFPTTLESKFIQNPKLIESLFDNPYLKNIEGIITCDSKEHPDKLLWGKIHEKFFSKYDGKRYVINRAIREPRWIGIDLAHSRRGDVLGFTLLHQEYSRSLKNRMYVTDFSFAIGPGENGINLDAVSKFIVDLVLMGNLNIQGVATDTFQSESLSQYLKRNGIEVKKQSVDKDINSYMFLLSCLLSETIKSGKNIFIKNNFMALQSEKTDKGKSKIDHTKGERVNKYMGDFKNSKSGINAKDVTDSLAQAVVLARDTDYYPATIYEDENQKAEDELKFEESIVGGVKVILGHQKKQAILNSIHPTYM